MKKGMLLSLFVTPLFLVCNAVTAYAAPSVYQNTASVGNHWYGNGWYDDGLSTGDVNGGVIVADATGDMGDVFTHFELKGSINANDSILLTFYDQKGPGSEGQAIGTMTLHTSDLGKTITIPYNNAYGMKIEFDVSSGIEGAVWLYETWSTDTDISTTGQVLWTLGDMVSTTTTSGGTDWDQVAEIFINHWFQDAPPIPDPPPSIPPITNPVDPTPPVSPPSTFTNPVVPTPTEPTQQPPDTTDWTSGTSDAIDVPTTGDSAFEIPDPVVNLPHDPPDTQPIPGSEPDQGYTPSPSGYTDAPTTGSSAPTTSGDMPTPVGSGGTILGDIPTYTGQTPGTTDVPTPSYSGLTDPGGPLPGDTSGSSGTLPTYQPGSSGTDTPVYQYP